MSDSNTELHDKKSRDVSEEQSREVAESSRQKDWRKPSFMKDMFLGDFRSGMIYPFPQLDEPDRPEYVAFRERFKKYLLEEVDALRIDAEGQLPENVIPRLAELGALGMNMPREYGGQGFSKYEYCRMMELSNSYEGSLMGFLSPHQSVGVPEVVKLFGTREQKDKYLRRAATGDITAFALTENEVGSDPARLMTTVVRSPDGNGYLLNGEKLWCTNGTVAKLLIVMARHEESGKISAFIVETDWEGVEVAHRCRFMGLAALENGVLTFNNVFVPKENLISEEGSGLRIALTALNTGRLSIPYGVLGAAKKSLECARTWAKERVQWGRPIVEHEAIAHMLSGMAAKVFAMESIVLLACRFADEGEKDLRLEAAAAKLWNTTRAWEIIDDTMQIRGGRGYEKETSLINRGETPMPVERTMRDLRIARIFEGASEIMHLLMAREAVDKHLQVAGAMVDPKASIGTKLAALPKVAAFYAWWYPTRWLGFKGRFGYGEFGPLAGHMRYIDRASKRLARQAFHGMMVYQAKLEKKQAFLFRWVDIAADLFAMAATVSRARTMQVQGLDHADDAVAMADLFCKNTRLQVNDRFRALWKNHDSDNFEIAQRVADGDYAWLEDGTLSIEEVAAAQRRFLGLSEEVENTASAPPAEAEAAR